MKIDLNADLGESFGPWKMGEDEQMMAVISSANIACGGHAGDNTTMHKTVLAAQSSGVTIGAHPGFADREGFGRRRLPLSSIEITRLVAAQLGALAGVAALAGEEVVYVKPHGALGNWAAEDTGVADAVANAVLAVMGTAATILAISGTSLERVARAKNIRVYSEIFADRAYTQSGHLVPRGQDGAMIHDADEASERLLRFLESGLMPTLNGDAIKLQAHSICVHGDGPNALTMARKIRQSLAAAGVSIQSFMTN